MGNNKHPIQKFLHTADLHLGKSLGDFDLYEDQDHILKQITLIAEREKVSGLLIAGDVYDKTIPSEAATRLLDSFLSTLAKKKIPVFLISGNHDSDERLHFGSSLFEQSGIFIASKFQGALQKHSIHTEDMDTDIYLLPFVKASRVRHYLPEAKIDTYDDAVSAIIENTKINKDHCNILLAHQFVTGSGGDPAFGGSESLGTQSVGTVEKISSDRFSDFDYVALGHIHSPQKVGREEIRYSGSPLKYSLSEVNNEKSVTLISAFDKENIQIDPIPLKPLRNMRHLRGPLKELLNPAHVSDPDDFIYATLTDEEMVNDVMGIFQQTYPRTVKIDYDNSHTREIEQVDISRIAENRSFADLISDFYQQMYGEMISEDEMKIMRDVAKEAGVVYEAD